MYQTGERWRESWKKETEGGSGISRKQRRKGDHGDILVYVSGGKKKEEKNNIKKKKW